MTDLTQHAETTFGGVDPRSYPPKLSELDAFREHMAGGWGEPDRTPGVVEGAADAARRHRGRLSDAVAGSTVVVAAGYAPVRANDTMYGFRPSSDFVWLTGAVVEGAVLVMRPSAAGHDATLFLPAPAYPGDPGFFEDPMHGELWVGAAPSLAGWSEALGMATRTLDDLDEVLGAPGEILVAGASDARLVDRPRSDTLVSTLAELRMFKDTWELSQLRLAVDLTVGGFGAVAGEIATAVGGGGERWLQGTFERYARTYGNDVGYTTIVGSGRHAPTLHWVRCDGPVTEGDALLLDMGVEAKSLYTADVTRTLPVSGMFSPEQRQVHDLVEKAHRAGLAQVGPGKPFTAFHHAAMHVVAQGLHDWGLLPVSVDEALSPQGQQHRRYLVCGIGHHLGLDVHDCSASSRDAYPGATMAPGMVLTVEPGLYFHAHDLTVPPELRGIGVRIEDDVLVTRTSSEVLSAALPMDATGLEQWIAR